MVSSKQGSSRSYIIGFVLSLILTLLVYWLVWQHVSSHHLTFSHSVLTLGIGGLAIIQFIVQLVFFFHMGRESRPRWNLMMFGFMLLVIGIVVGGSLWIMQNLDYHHPLPSKDIDSFIIKDEGIH